MSNYKIVEVTNIDGKNENVIELQTGDFAGTLFNFGKIQFMGEDEDGFGKLNFDYNLFFTPETITLNEDTRPLLEEVIADILREIMENTLEEMNETRTSDSE